MKKSKQSRNDTLLALQATMVIIGQNHTDEELAISYIHNPGFLKILRSVDIEVLSEQQLRNHKKYLKDPNFIPTKMARTNEFCQRMCEWNHSISEYQKAKADQDNNNRKLS